jgi:hypothetical protein
MKLVLKSMWNSLNKSYLFWGFVGGVVLGCLELLVGK